MLRRVVLFLGAVLCAASLSAAVCYNPESRGLRVSRYQLDTLTSSFLSHPIDFSADPWEVAGSEFLDYSRPEIFAAYERRYGKGTACMGGLASDPRCGGHVFKRFAGAGNEVRDIVANALAWASGSASHLLGGRQGCISDGKPSEREVTDAQATNDFGILMEFHAKALSGGQEGSAIEACRPDKPATFSEVDPFWGWRVFFRNTCAAPPPATSTPAAPAPSTACPPPAPAVVACEAPPADVLAAAKRVQALSSAKVAGQKVLDWLAAQSKRCSGPK